MARDANVRPVVPVPGRRLVRGAQDAWARARGVSATTLRQRAGGPWHAGQAYSARGALSFAAPAMPYRWQIARRLPGAVRATAPPP